MVAITRRIEGKYRTHYSDPIWPDPTRPLAEEIDRMMRLCLSRLEESIRELPGQWLWIHNRWKQQTPEKLKRAFRHECLCIVMPEQREEFEAIALLLPTFRALYPLEFVTLFVPRAFEERKLLEDADVVVYDEKSELFVEEHKFKLVFNFSGVKALSTHFKRLSAFTVVDLPKLKKLSGARCDAPLAEHLTKAVCRAP